MQLIQQITLQAIEILTLIFGILGMTFCFLLLFSPNLTKSISHVLNRYVSLAGKFSYLDKNVQIESFIYNHHVLFSTFLIAGSLFSLIFFFFKLDVSNFANIFFISHKYPATNEMIFDSVSWVGKVSCFFGLALGAVLFFAPDKMRQIGKKMNFWFETGPIFDKLNNSNRELDTILFRHPVIFGLAGLIISFFLVILSILNLLT